MKAVLVIDMPTDCVKCPLGNCYCWKTFPIKGRADGCPLRPLPREWTMDEVEPCAYNEGFVDGLNHCIYLITGETE